MGATSTVAFPPYKVTESDDSEYRDNREPDKVAWGILAIKGLVDQGGGGDGEDEGDGSQSSEDEGLSPNAILFLDDLKRGDAGSRGSVHDISLLLVDRKGELGRRRITIVKGGDEGMVAENSRRGEPFCFDGLCRPTDQTKKAKARVFISTHEK